MSPTLQIARAESSQAEKISHLITSLAGYFVPDQSNAAPFLASISTESIAGYIANPAFSYFCATFDGALCGIIALRDNQHVYHLFVASHFQGRGIARALWEQVKTDALRKDNTVIFTVNSWVNAVPLYRRFGFRVMGAEVERNGVRYVPMQLDGDAR